MAHADVNIAVLMPTWNRADLLPATIDSILAQTHRDFTLYIYDDGSDDGTDCLVADYQKADARINYIRSETNDGFPSAMNNLLNIAATAGHKYACLQGSDDPINRYRLADQLAAIRRTDADVVVTGFRWLRKTRADTSRRHPRLGADRKITLAEFRKEYSQICNGSAMFALAGALDIGFDVALSLGGSDRKFIEDIIAGGGAMVWLPSELYYVRRHAGRITDWSQRPDINPAWYARMTDRAAGPQPKPTGLAEPIHHVEMTGPPPLPAGSAPPEICDTVRMTVGLPLYKARDIAWLALESLCRQENVPTDWELIVAEEVGEDFEPLGEDELNAYADRLAAVRCREIIYVPLAEWIMLTQKWRMICRLSAPTSELFFIQDADCYSQPHRLAETWAIFDAGPSPKSADWIQSPCGIFYQIRTGRQLLYDCRPKPRSTELNMAVRTDLMRRLPPGERWNMTNSWMKSNAKKINGGTVKTVRNTSESWKLGVDTHGCGAISKRDAAFLSNSPAAPWYTAPIDVLDHLPADIAERLRECRELTNTEGHVRRNLVKC